MVKGKKQKSWVQQWTDVRGENKYTQVKSLVSESKVKKKKIGKGFTDLAVPLTSESLTGWGCGGWICCPGSIREGGSRTGLSLNHGKGESRASWDSGSTVSWSPHNDLEIRLIQRERGLQIGNCQRLSER